MLKHYLRKNINKQAGLSSETLFLCVFLCLSVGCNQEKTLFTKRSPEETGITFVNEVHDTDSLNIIDYLYFYNGGGVAVGDVNNDGFTDIYFTSNMGSNQLYLNMGQQQNTSFQFEDITRQAGVAGTGNWNTGVTMADVNGDGWLDMYVCTVGKFKNLQGKNQLFINQGAPSGQSPVFTEEAATYGLDLEGFNTQAAFFDYDKDGDLDMFLVNHSVHSTATYGDVSNRAVKSEVSGDKLMRNDRVNDRMVFTDVTEEAGIYSSIIGYGLNVITADLNNDGWEDIYVSNDFHEDDYYYLNQGDGSFKEISRQAFGHQSRFSMGSDIADINNDGWQDIMTLDMLPADQQVLKSSTGDDPLDIYQFKLKYGYHHQYSRNCLQLNVAAGTGFSDVALFGGIAATDWSWSPLLADFDNDGIKDIFISNGIFRRPNDQDYIKFTSNETISKSLQNDRSADWEAIRQMPPGEVHNYIFQGTDSLQFTDQSAAWGFDTPDLSNGAAYADFDNDGDLDLVVNSINTPAGIYQNHAHERFGNNFLTVQLKGEGGNPFGYGAKVVLKQNGRLQLNQLTATRGFQSGSDQLLHFGLSKDSGVDSLEIIWPDNHTQLLTRVPVNQRLVVEQKNASNTNSVLLPSKSSYHPLFEEVTDSINLPFQHKENDYVDFNYQAFIPHQISTQGTKLAVGDMNGDGLDDFYVGGARFQSGALFQQTAAGKFQATNTELWAEDSLSEEVNALFFDADTDGDLDLYVVCGGNEYAGEYPQLRDRLYLNDGKGNFSKTNTLPALYGNHSVATAADFDHDDDQDLFVGGRVMSKKYGETPASFLLMNDGKGNFTVADTTLAPGLQTLGMVTDAAWADLDNDGWEDLVITGEWMPITVYKNNQGILTNVTAPMGLQNSSGWWNTLKVEDIDGDGDLDLLAGNWGENSKLHASEDFPLKLYVDDLDQNGDLDQILAVEKDGAYYPFLGKDELGKQLPGIIRKKYLAYKTFATETVEQIFGEKLQNTRLLMANHLSSMLFKNNGDETFTPVRLPAAVQQSPVFSFMTGDFNQDDRTDLIAAGNFYGVLPYEGRYDASYGAVMLGNKSLQVLSPLQSGFVVTGEIRDIKALRTIGGKLLYVVARNNDSLVFFQLNQAEISNNRLSVTTKN